MESIMARNNISDNDRLRTVEEIVDDTIRFFRNRGHKRDVAIEQTALALGLTPRKTRSVFYGETFALLDCEIRHIRRAFARHLDERADDLARRSQEARMRRRQMDMEL